jgi:hypothetical protein
MNAWRPFSPPTLTWVLLFLVSTLAWQATELPKANGQSRARNQAQPRTQNGARSTKNPRNTRARDVDPEKKKLLTPDDFRFVGAFLLPQSACGSNTSYASGCLAIRTVNQERHLFSDTHVETGGKVYEALVPPPSLAAPYPTARLLREWGDIYQGRKQKANGESYDLGGHVPTTGLRWDDAEQGLWWTYGERYNTENQDAPTLGFTHIEGTTATPKGPWRIAAPQSWQRGGTLQLPTWFADAHTRGHRFAIGFGGYYSIFEGGSYGPALSVTPLPEERKPLPHVTLLAYPAPHLCEREPNYEHASGGWMGTNPVRGRGTWNATDEIGGEAYAGGGVWIDAGDRHALVFCVSLGTGRIAYEDGGVQAEGRIDSVYLYDPADLALVAARKKPSWSPVPQRYPLKNPAPGLAGRAAGLAYDEEARRLYVVFVHAYSEGEESFPAVVVYQL